MVRISACHAEGRGFESRPLRQQILIKTNVFIGLNTSYSSKIFFWYPRWYSTTFNVLLGGDIHVAKSGEIHEIITLGAPIKFTQIKPHPLGTFGFRLMGPGTPIHLELLKLGVIYGFPSNLYDYSL